MDENHFMLISLEDSKSKAIAEVLGSKTCKKIIGYLSERKQASQKDLSDALSIPMNTLDYNVKKLLESGFIQKRKNFFWSKKGKKIVMYELSNKSIVISPKKAPSQKLKSILPAFILTAAGTFAIWAYERIKYVSQYSRDTLLKGAEVASVSVGGVAEDSTNYLMTPHPTPIWAWFLAGALLATLIISIINWKKL
jgi:predicted transcriptional regulator